MSKTKDLRKFSPEQLEEFLDSFDIVLSDCDGVLWHLSSPIDGAVQSLKRLQELGKRVYLVSNNSTMSVDRYLENTRKSGFEVTPEQIIITPKVIAWYLKKINFREEIYVIASAAFQEILRDAGIKFSDAKPEVIPMNVMETVKSVQDKPSVKAIVIDFDVNCNWAKLAFAVSCLQRKEVLFLTGAQDEWVVCGKDQRLLGVGALIDAISAQIDRKPTACAKPSEILRDYITDVCKVSDPKRCLFIGDTIKYDMTFGSMCGFRKFFVGTGLDRLEDAQKDEGTCPDYYLPSLGQLISLLDDLPCDRTPNSTDS